MIWTALVAFAGHFVCASASIAAPNSNPLTIPARSSSAQSYCSSSDRNYNLSSFDLPVQGRGTPGSVSTWQLSFDDTSSGLKQVVSGFGAAVTDATVSVINALPSATQAQLLKELFTSTGVNFSQIRVTIGASDLSADPAYTYDDHGGTVDTSLSGFYLGDRGQAMASLVAEMRSLQPGLQIVGSVWSPPGWMKLNGVIDGNTTQNNLNHSYESQYGQYFVKYLQAYQAAGAPINSIAIQNEPLNSQAGYPTMYVYADESGSLIQNVVGPALAAANLNTKVWAYDHNTDVPSYPQTVLEKASKYVNTVAWHCYASNNDWSVLTEFHNNNTGVEQVMTECWTSNTTSWNQASSFTLGPLQNWATGAMAWTLGSDQNFGPHLSSGGCATCRGLFVVNTSTGTYEFQVDYYMLGQYSKFIPQGSTILKGTGSYTYSDGNGIQATASLNPDGSKTVVMENKFPNDVYVTVNFTSGSQWSGRVYSESVVTWVV